MVMMVQLVSNHSCFSVIFARIKTCKLLTYEVYLMFIFMSMFYDQNAECYAILVVFMHLKLLPESEHDLLSCFYCLVLLLFLFCHFSANGPFSCFFSSENLKYFPLRVRLFCMALVEQLGDDSW